MKPAQELIAEALQDLHKGESIERALGRIVRRHGGTYDEYIRIMGDVRDVAAKEKLSAIEAARRLSQV